MSKVKRLLVGMLIVGAITAATASGTFATFNASTSNSGTVTSGTLLLGNTANTGTECISTADTGAANTITAGNTNTCDVLFSGFVNPTGSATAYLTLKNEGNFNAANSTLSITSCNSTVNTVTVNGHTWAGDPVAKPLCGVLQLVIAEVTTSNGSTLGGSGCIYGDAAVNSPLTACGYSNSFLASGTGGPYALGAMAAGASKFYVVDVNFPDTSDNRYQGQNAALTLTWTLNQ